MTQLNFECVPLGLKAKLDFGPDGRNAAMVERIIYRFFWLVIVIIAMLLAYLKWG